MKVTLSFEESISSDVSIMVDALRASTTITLALDNFNRIIPCFSPEEAFELKDKIGGVLAGERGGKQIDGFDIGNSPFDLKDLKSDEDTLILTTSNGTRILEKMTSKVIVGSMVNAKAVGVKSSQIATEHIDVVMAGVKGEFAIEDFLASGEILYWICENLNEYEISEYAKAAILASRDYNSLKDAFMNSRSAKRLIELGYKDDVELCCLKNISDNVATYENNELKLIKD
ncbi:MAG: 2-phosphosulfolactate phosphatase [Methanobrevibacter sp.]|nr:2-phosphosulfolactate phosphatase [Methanobrevibacter sp.]